MGNVTVVRERNEMPFIVRVLWFFLVGWHVTLYWILIAWLLNVSIIGLPLGLWMLDRVPLVLTLRMPSSYTAVQVRHGQVVGMGSVATPQANFLLRLVYFLLIGWWLSLLWSLLAWLLCVSIIGLPFGVMMFNRLPEITTLHRV